MLVRMPTIPPNPKKCKHKSNSIFFLPNVKTLQEQKYIPRFKVSQSHKITSISKTQTWRQSCHRYVETRTIPEYSLSQQIRMLKSVHHVDHRYISFLSVPWRSDAVRRCCYRGCCKHGCFSCCNLLQIYVLLRSADAVPLLLLAVVLPAHAAPAWSSLSAISCTRAAPVPESSEAMPHSVRHVVMVRPWKAGNYLRNR